MEEVRTGRNFTIIKGKKLRNISGREISLTRDKKPSLIVY